MNTQNNNNLLRQLNLISWMLRVGACATFLGHGFFAFHVKLQWINYLLTVGFSRENAVQLMPLIGILDFTIAFFLLIKPFNVVIIWAIFWTLLTALMRPISGESVFDFVERGANWTVPLVLFFVKRIQEKIIIS
jgi:hypothetical protein